MTTTITLTEESVRASIKANIDLMGEDYVYEKPPGRGICLYMFEDRPSCLIGRILYDHGVPLSELAECETHGAYEVAENFAPATEPSLLNRLALLQWYQDRGYTWGTSARHAKFL